MVTLIEEWSQADILTPAQQPGDARPDAVAWGANLTVRAGQAVGIKTSDKKAYPYGGIGVATNEVQTLTFGVAASGGTLRLSVPKTDGTMVTTAVITWDTTDATYLAAINTALDAATGVVGGIVATGAAPDTALTFTFSGTGYAAKSWNLIEVVTYPTSTTTANVVRTTTGGAASDGTQTCVGWSMYSFKTDANGLVYYSGSAAAAANIRVGPHATSPIFKTGIFDPADLLTHSTPVAQVDTFTPGGTIEVGDIFTLTASNNAGQTASVSFTATATTAANVSAGLIAAWNASTNPLHVNVTASGSSTVILTADNAGVPFTVTGTTTEADGTAADSQTFVKVSTTANVGKTFTDILTDMGGRILPNGFLYFP